MSVQNKEYVKFYILVPVYNTEKYIHHCIDSILQQTYSNYEAILVDDGSPDHAGVICDEYAQKDRRIHVIHKQNEGQISARQTGIDFVKTISRDENCFFIFLDSDDTLNADALAVVADTIIKSNCDLVVYGVQRVYQGKVISQFEENPYSGEITDKRQLYKRVFGSAAYNSLCRKAIKCDLMKKEDYGKFYHIKHGEDLLHSIPVYKQCRKAVFIPDVLYNYTVNPQSITQSISYRNYPVDSTVRAEVWKFLQEENCFTVTDEAEYLQYCCKFLKGKVIQICGLQTSRENIIALFKQIRNDPYYSMLLNTKYKGLLLACLKNEKYSEIIRYVKVREFLAKIYRKLNTTHLGEYVKSKCQLP